MGEGDSKPKASTTATSTVDRDTLRERERKSRQRRAARVELMREQVKALECAMSIVPLIGEPDMLWDEFLDVDSKRVRAYLRRIADLSQELQQLTNEKTQLTKLMQEHEMAKKAITRMLKEASADDWEWNVKRLRAITQLHFRPLTMDDAEELMEAAVKEMNAFMWSGEKQTTGLSFLGWRDRRRVDPVHNAFQFSFYKTFKNDNCQFHMDQYWKVYTDGKMYRRVIFGDNAHVWVEVLQKISSTIFVVRYAERYPEMPVDAHVLYLLFRVKTDTGYAQCLRSIPMPDMQRATDSPRDVWTSNCVWFRWDLLDNSEDLTRANFQTTLGGRLTGDSINYATRWLVEVIASVIRAEHISTGRNLLTFFG